VQTEDLQQAMLDIASQLDHLESLTHKLEPVDEQETNSSIHRTKLHRFIRIDDDLTMLNERLINMNDRSLCLLAGDQLRLRNDLKLTIDRLNSVQRIVRIYLERLEQILARKDLQDTNLLKDRSALVRRSTSTIQVGHFRLTMSISSNICSCYLAYLSNMIKP
jgi:hypothetical protein